MQCGIKHQFEWEELIWKFLSELIVLNYLKIGGSITDSEKLDIKIKENV